MHVLMRLIACIEHSVKNEINTLKMLTAQKPKTSVLKETEEREREILGKSHTLAQFGHADKYDVTRIE